MEKTVIYLIIHRSLNIYLLAPDLKKSSNDFSSDRVRKEERLSLLKYTVPGAFLVIIDAIQLRYQSCIHNLLASDFV